MILKKSCTAYYWHKHQEVSTQLMQRINFQCCQPSAPLFAPHHLCPINSLFILFWRRPDRYMYLIGTAPFGHHKGTTAPYSMTHIQLWHHTLPGEHTTSNSSHVPLDMGGRAPHLCKQSQVVPFIHKSRRRRPIKLTPAGEVVQQLFQFSSRAERFKLSIKTFRAHFSTIIDS